jgi:tRNA uridine 5-carbamoylmethylation protein Kti12
MSYFIIIRGPLGIGKSTIAKRLAKILKAEYVPVDLVLEKHGLDEVDENAGCIPASNFIRADDFILPSLEKKLKDGKKIIFDACFYHKGHIEHIVQHLPYPHYVFSLKAPLEVCIERDHNRKKTHGKDAAAVVYQLVSRFDYGIVIDVSGKNIDQSVKEILSHLPERSDPL